MFRFFLLSCLIAITSMLCFAENPQASCFSGRSVDDVFGDQRAMDNGKKFIIVVGQQSGVVRSPYQQADWDRSIWNDDQIAEYLHEHGIEVVYFNGNESPAFYSTLDIHSLPKTLFYAGSRQISTRSGLKTANEDSRQEFIDWVDALRSGRRPVDDAYQAVALDSMNAELRFELMSELWKERCEVEYLEQLCWLFDHNDLYAEHTLRVQEDKTGEQQSEIDVRISLYWQIMSLRDNLQLFNRDTSTGYGWGSAQKRVENANAASWRKLDQWSERRVKENRLLLDLRSVLESRRDEGTASERDLFILRVMTSEGEELKLLVNEMKPHIKRR